jgi:hypothetical protein
MESVEETTNGTRLVPYDPDWLRKFEAERERIAWDVGPGRWLSVAGAIRSSRLIVTPRR